jgi:hypothetical protein
MNAAALFIILNREDPPFLGVSADEGAFNLTMMDGEGLRCFHRFSKKW